MGNRVCGLLLIGVCFCLSGCVTATLWEDHALDGFNKPAGQPNLQVSRCDGDWLVQYDEVNEDSGRVRRRAYILRANDERVRVQKPPRFVPSPDAADGEARAEVLESGHEFTLYDGDKAVGTFALPIYPKPSGRVKQILLTPLTVTVDAAIVSACVVGYAWLHSNTHYHSWDCD